MNLKSSIDIVLPVYHGNLFILRKNIPLLIPILSQKLKEFEWKIIISVNGLQSEEILRLSKELSEQYPCKIHYLYTPKPGKGWGVINAWQQSNAAIKAFMDVDLSTHPKDIYHLIEPLLLNESDIVVGSRFLEESLLQRSFIRQWVSTIYNHIFVRFLLNCPIRDLQCGFKAVNTTFIKEVLPLVKDREWFFETEMLYLAYKKGLRVKEIPVEWHESKISGLHLRKAIPQFILKTFQLRYRRF